MIDRWLFIACLVSGLLNPALSRAEAPEGLFSFPLAEATELYGTTFAVGTRALDKSRIPTTCRPMVFNGGENIVFNTDEFKIVPSTETDPARFNALAADNLKRLDNGQTWVACGSNRQKIVRVTEGPAKLRARLQARMKGRISLDIELDIAAAFSLRGTKSADVFFIETSLKGAANRYPAILGLNEKNELIALVQPTNTD